VYMCNLPMSVLSGPHRIRCGEAALQLTVIGADGGAACLHVRPTYVGPGGSRWIRCGEAVLRLTAVGADGGGDVHTCVPYLCRFWVDLVGSDARRLCSGLRWPEWWRRRAYICALPMSVLGESHRIR
jgi:hypothetical protein